MRCVRVVPRTQHRVHSTAFMRVHRKINTPTMATGEGTTNVYIVYF